jgi:hypothetical protein
MYNTLFKCTYNLIKENDEDYDLTDDLYRSQLLQAFNLNELDSGYIDKLFIYLNKILMSNERGNIILTKMKNNTIYPIDDVLVLLFSYEYFHLFHDCLIDLINDNYISDEKFNLLIHQIENN